MPDNTHASRLQTSGHLALHGAQHHLTGLDELIDFRRIYFLLLKRLWIIILVIVIGMIGVASWLARQPRIYESRAVIQVEEQEQKILKVESVSEDIPSNADFVNTVAQALTSRNIMLRVIRANNLDKNPIFAPPKLGGGQYTDEQFAALLEKKVKVAVRRSTRLIDITVEDQDPQLAAKLAISFVKEFFRESFEQRVSVSHVANDFLSEEATKLKKKLEESEQNLQRYKENNNAVSLEESQNITVKKLQEMNTAQTEAKNARLKLEADLEQIKRLNPKDTEALLQISSIASVNQVVTARQELLKATSDLDTLKEHYLPKHPKYIAAMNTVEGLKVALQEAVAKASEEVAQQYTSAYQTETKMDAALKEQENKALELNKLAIHYNVLAREVDSDKALFDSVISRMKETSVTAGVETVPYRIIEEPLVPSRPTKPLVKQTLLLAFILLLVGTSSVIIVLDYMSSSIRSVDEVESLLQLPALGAIPDQKLSPPEKATLLLERESEFLPKRLQRVRSLISHKLKGKKITKRWLSLIARSAPLLPIELAAHSYPIAIVDEPDSPLAESYRTLRASISLLGSQESTSVLLFTSAVPEEGKTFCTLNTAASFAQLGQKTLIIDADMRRPSVHKALLTQHDGPGLAEFLSGLATLDQVILPTIIPNLFMISGASTSRNPAELLSSSDLNSLILELKKRFDKVVFDTAPINAVSDTLILASVGQIIMVVRADKTAKQAVQRAIKLLKKSGANIAGVVLNRMSRGASAGYYYYYYGDKYLKDSVYGTTKDT